MNGAAAVRLLPDPPSTQPAAPGEPVERRIAVAVADCVATMGQGMIDYTTLGGFAPRTREAAGNFFVTLFELQQATIGELDFHAVARAQARILIRQRASSQSPGADRAALDRLLDILLDAVLDVLAKVTRDERARAN